MSVHAGFDTHAYAHVGQVWCLHGAWGNNCEVELGGAIRIDELFLLATNAYEDHTHVGWLIVGLVDAVDPILRILVEGEF